MIYPLKEFDHYLEKLFDERGLPGVSVTIRGPGTLIYERGFGHRSIDRDLPMTGDTICGIASMSKSFTTFALAILAAEGKVSFDDPVAKYLPEFRVPGIPPECVTIRHLAMHTSGIPPIQPLEWSIALNSVERDSEWHREMLRTSPNQMDQIEQIIQYIAEGDYGEPGYGTLGSPGEYMSYSNEGYAILCYVFDAVSDVPLEEFLRDRIFGPLGMTRTILDLDGSEARLLEPQGNMTSLFERDEDGKLIEDDDWSVLPPFRSCACIKSTTSDLTKYYQMLSRGGKVDRVQVFPEKAVDLLIGSGFPLQERPYYCFGLSKRLFHGRIICEHDGGLHGVSTGGGLIDGGYSAAVFCNEGDVDTDPFKWAAYNLLLGLPFDTDHCWAKPSGAVFSAPEALEGDYVCQEGMPQHLVIAPTAEREELPPEEGIPAVYQGDPVLLRYCFGSVFAAYSRRTPGKRVSIMEFYIRNGQAWGVRCGSRIYQRKK